MLIHAHLGDRVVPVALVAVGALLVGSIRWSPAARPGATVRKGDELGWFQYGGSTVVLVFPAAAGVQWDADLAASSAEGVETIVRAGNHIGRV